MSPLQPGAQGCGQLWSTQSIFNSSLASSQAAEGGGGSGFGLRIEIRVSQVVHLYSLATQWVLGMYIEI